MNLISLLHDNLEQYIKDHYVVIDSDEISLKMPTIHIIGMNDFQETLNEYLNYSLGDDELIVCLPSNDIFDYLNDYFTKSTNAENQFLVDAYRSVMFYNCRMFAGEDNINELNQILQDEYEPILLKKIYCLCSQGALAYIICAFQEVLYERNSKHIISELESDKQAKLEVNIIESHNKINVVIHKKMRVVHIKSKKIETLRVLRFQIEYLINMENEEYTVESVIGIHFD
jgi:hypothetical protein